MVTTQAIWTLPMEQSTIDATIQKAAEMAEYEVQPVQTQPGPGPNEKTVYRYWIDLPTAQTWIDFLLPLNPVSAQIVSE